MKTGRVVGVQLGSDTFEEERILGVLAKALESDKHRFDITYGEVGQPAHVAIATKDANGNPHFGDSDAC